MIENWISTRICGTRHNLYNDQRELERIIIVISIPIIFNPKF